MNIYEFENKKNVKIVTDDGKEYIGTVLSIMDENEMDNMEPMVDIETQNGIFGILESEIASMEIIL